MNTRTDVLVRKTTDIDPNTLIRSELLSFASTELGYKHPETVRLVKNGVLASALRIAGIVPFDLKSVEAYQASKSKPKKTSVFGKRLSAIWTVTFVSTILLGIICANSAPTGQALKAALLPIFVGDAIACVVTLIILVFMMQPAVPGQWHLRELRGYSDAVPGFALETAKEVYARVPEAKFYVHEFIEDGVQTDPFLVAILEREKYYIEVWEEPGFDQKRKV